MAIKKGCADVSYQRCKREKENENLLKIFRYGQTLARGMALSRWRLMIGALQRNFVGYCIVWLTLTDDLKEFILVTLRIQNEGTIGVCAGGTTVTPHLKNARLGYG